MGARALGKLPIGGQRLQDPTKLTHEYFQHLVSEDWMKTSDGKGYMGGVKGVTIRRDDILLVAAAEYLAVAQEYAGNQDLFMTTLASAWTKLMNADRFDGPTRNVCDATADDDDDKPIQFITNGKPVTEDNTDPNSVLVIESVTRYLITVIVALSFTLVLSFGILASVLCCPRKEKWGGEYRQKLTNRV